MRIALILFWLVTLASCGSTSEDAEADDPSNTVNTEKLIGTPFEGLTTGDDLEFTYFLCGQYRTDTIDTYPIKIFTAFFTPNEEEIIQEGIDIANEGIGFTLYELTDTWSDDLRVIYQVGTIADGDEFIFAAGYTNGTSYFFTKQLAEMMTTDWSIEIAAADLSKWLVAHELGHSVGILNHALIDYVNDTVTDLEEKSLMASDGGGANPALTDYNFMMQMQGQIILNHLGEIGRIQNENCTE